VAAVAWLCLGVSFAGGQTVTDRSSDEAGAEIRPAAMAGKFYPSDPVTLRRAIDLLIAQARPAVAEDVTGMVVPHAGYMFSGQIAADALVHLATARPDVVVVLGANHAAPAVRGFALHPGRAFRTPLGDLPIDRDLTRALVDAKVGARTDAAPHKDEHSIEVILPFVQVMAPQATFVPVIVGDLEGGQAQGFARALAAALADRRAFVVASSDLSHYPGVRDAGRADRTTLEQILRFDGNSLILRERQTVERQAGRLVTIACGLGPIVVAMSVARAMGAAQATVISYANSADVAVGDPNKVVGYGAVAFHRDARRGPALPAELDGGDTRSAGEPDAPLAPADRQVLLRLARASFARFLQSETLPLPRDLPPSLASRRQGAFVTLKRRGELRGCVGTLDADFPLPHLVSRAAFGAAFGDARFTPLGRDEVDRVEVEISLLTPAREVASPREIVVGRDGVVLKKSGKSAVFLPYVATEAGWSRDQMLDELCVKAGLRERCWTDRATLATFQAEVFDERDLRR
jgi:hypothetical protein